MGIKVIKKRALMNNKSLSTYRFLNGKRIPKMVNSGIPIPIPRPRQYLSVLNIDTQAMTMDLEI
jgi:hypothetical protein